MRDRLLRSCAADALMALERGRLCSFVVDPMDLMMGGSSIYQIPYACRSNDDDTPSLARTPAVGGSERIATYRLLVKRANLGTTQRLVSLARTASGNNALTIGFNTSDQLDVVCENDAGAVILRRTTTKVFRDPSAWLDVVIRIDGNQTTDACCTIEVNGTTITIFGTKTNLGAATDLNLFNTSKALGIFRSVGAGNHFDGYLGGDSLIVDGTAYAAINFGELDAYNNWRPKRVSGITFGTNGVKFDFADSANLGNDVSGNNNDFTSSGLAAADQVTDAPTTNYCTLNPIDNNSGGTGLTLSDGGLVLTGISLNRVVRSTFWVSSGKWYWEVVWTSTGTAGNQYIGVVNANAATSGGTGTIGGDANGWGYYAANGNKLNNGASVAYGAAFTAGDVIGVALDMDAGTLTFYKNNLSQGTAFSGLTGMLFPAGSTSDAGVHTFNFGQKAFSYTPPAGHVGINTANIAAPAIKNPNDHFHVELVSKSGNTSFTLPWNAGTYDTLFIVKRRSGATGNWYWIDGLRGYNKYLISNGTASPGTDGEATDANVISVAGATITLGATLADAAYVVYCFKAGLAAGRITNSAGLIQSTVSVNASSGFAIIIYTGTGAVATVGHSLPAAPGFFTSKKRSAAGTDWQTYHVGMGATGNDFLLLNGNNAGATSAAPFNDLDPTSTLINLGNSGAINAAGADQVIWAWCEIAGFSKIGYWIGNASTDGPCFDTGVSGEFALIKFAYGAQDWRVYDGKRGARNPNNAYLAINSNAVESASEDIDLLARALKPRNTGLPTNASASRICALVIGRHPFGGAGIPPAPAR